MSVCIAICTCVESLSVGYSTSITEKKSAVGVTPVAGITFRTRTFSKFSSRDIRRVSTVILIKFHKVSQGLGRSAASKPRGPRSYEHSASHSLQTCEIK